MPKAFLSYSVLCGTMGESIVIHGPRAQREADWSPTLSSCPPSDWVFPISPTACYIPSNAIKTRPTLTRNLFSPLLARSFFYSPSPLDFQV